MKKLDEEHTEKRIAYEVSVSKMEVLSGGVEAVALANESHGNV